MGQKSKVQAAQAGQAGASLGFGFMLTGPVANGMGGSIFRPSSRSVGGCFIM